MRQHSLSEQDLASQQSRPDAQRAKTWIAIRDTLTPEQKNRLWEQHLRTYEDFNNRLNFFLVFESVLLGVVAMLFSKSSSEKLVLAIIICLGLVLTIMWGYIQARQKYIRDRLQVRIQEVLPEYRAILEDRDQIKKWPFSSISLLSYGVPSLIVFIWILLLIYTLIT
jgi:hypothetical protein